MLSRIQHQFNLFLARYSGISQLEYEIKNLYTAYGNCEDCLPNLEHISTAASKKLGNLCPVSGINHSFNARG